MGSLQLHQFPKHLLLVILFSLCNNSINAQYEAETDALYALKHTFNDPFVNGNWNGLHCYENASFWDGIGCVNGRVTAILLESRGLSGTVSSDAFVSLSELVTVSLKNNSLSGNIMDFSSNPKLKDIDMSNNMLNGPIPWSLFSLEFLQSLQLQDNQLTGPMPEFNQKSLTVFNVSNNKIICPIPGTGSLKSLIAASYPDNVPNACGPSNTGTCYISENKTASSGDSKKKSVATILIVFDIIGLVTVILLLILYCKKSRKLEKLIERYRLDEKDDEILEMGGVSYNYKESREESISHVHHGVSTLVANQEKGNLIFTGDGDAGFDLNDLLRASAEGLGKGLFGNSYKAKLEGRPAVVVKRLRDLKPMSDDEFAKLIRIIGDQKHPNLLPLIAYYSTNDEKLFLYRFAKNGSLFNRLHGGRGTTDRIPIRWNLRLAIARAVARAMEYLHRNVNFSTCVVPHGNLKLSNVLLDEDDTVLVSDYGLASLVAVPIAAQRLVAYKSPEYHNSKRVSMKSDVWSYGCLLLELLTGRLSAHSAPPGINGVDLCSWVHRAVREEWTAEIFDMEISVQRNAAPGMLKLLQVAIRCCEKSPEKRPEMTEIVREIDSIKAVDSEEISDSADQSLTDESFSTNASTVLVVGDGRSW
ncbi:receptor-like kinase 1 [Hibiscus trionum]|uniref:Receptor-like kinase 1 n=1 Tax=Hibiscus trionum TaxID=183268 RepID=A0A9W7JH01_HIBTR|nr:receptor-like kinase 1 [Hibiscus trionum]